MKYKKYSLAGLPKNALPDPTKEHAGAHGYTVKKGAAKIEVLLRTRAFCVKTGERKGQITWSKHPSIRDAWIVACTRAGVLP